MARKRRSLLGGPSRRPGGGGSEGDLDPGESLDIPLQSIPPRPGGPPSAPPEREALQVVPTLAPGSTAAPGRPAAPPSLPPASREIAPPRPPTTNADTWVDDAVASGSYVGLGEMPTDTTDVGWSMFEGGSQQPAPPRVVQRAPTLPPAPAPPAPAPPPAPPAGLPKLAPPGDDLFAGMLDLGLDLGGTPVPAGRSDAPTGGRTEPQSGYVDFAAPVEPSAGFDFGDATPPTEDLGRYAGPGDLSVHEVGAPLVVPESPGVESLLAGLTPPPAPRRAPIEPPPPPRPAPAPPPEVQSPSLVQLDSDLPVLRETLPTEVPRQGEDRSLGRLVVALGVGVVLAVTLVAVTLMPWGAVLSQLQAGNPTSVPEEVTATPPPDGEVRGVKVRQSLRGGNPVFEVEPGEPAPAPSPKAAPKVKPAPAEPAEAAEGVDEVPAEDPTLILPSDAPDPVVPPKPEAAPAPPRPAPAPKPVAGPVGTLKVRANKRAVVYVNDNGIGYTPLDHPVPLGAYTVRVMLPGDPSSQKSREARIDAAGQSVALDFSF